MSLLESDSPYLRWRAEEAGIDERALNPHAEMLIPELEAISRSPARPDSPPKPTPNIDTTGRDNDYPLGDSRVAFVGAGAGTIMLAGHLAGRGVKPEHMTIFDPSGSFGGKWQSGDVRVGGFNNPMPLRFGAGHYLSLDDRSGSYMLEYLNGIARDRLGYCQFVPDAVSGIRSQRTEDAWLLETPEGHRSEADIVVLASGTPNPNMIDGERFRSNLDQFPARSESGSFAVERSQRELSDEELRQSAEGKPIVIIGLGNSMAAMIYQIQQYEDWTGSRLNYKILTDRSIFAVDDPTYGHDGKKPIFRNPQGDYLTGYSADLGRDRDSYYRALDGGHILPGVTDINYRHRSGKLAVKTGDGEKYQFESPQVFALIGNTPDLTLFRQVGALGLDHSPRSGFSTTRRLIRPADGAVFSHERGGYMSNVFAIGSVAATASNRNSLVIPGINGQAPSSTLTIGVRSIAEQLKVDALRARRQDLGRRVLKYFPEGETVHEKPLLTPDLRQKVVYEHNQPGHKPGFNEL